MKCPNCGFENQENATTCEACNGVLTSTQPNTESSDATRLGDAIKFTSDGENTNISINKDKLGDAIENTTSGDGENFTKSIISAFVPDDKVDEVYNKAMESAKNQEQTVSNEESKKQYNKYRFIGAIIGFAIILFIAFILFNS